MFWFRDQREGGVRVDVAFTDSSIDLQGRREAFPGELDRIETACGVRFARLHQVHGDRVVVVDEPGPEATSDDIPTADALVTARRGIGLMIRVADCVPVLLADPHTGVVGAVHSGRAGTAAGVTRHAVDRMRALGAESLVAWVGPRVCGGCYEVPEAMRDEVSAAAPATRAWTRWRTPSLDLGEGVLAELAGAGVETYDVGGCTREEPRLHSHRRDGASAGRLAGLVWRS